MFTGGEPRTNRPPAAISRCWQRVTAISPGSRRALGFDEATRGATPNEPFSTPIRARLSDSHPAAALVVNSRVRNARRSRRVRYRRAAYGNCPGPPQAIRLPAVSHLLRPRPTTAAASHQPDARNSKQDHRDHRAHRAALGVDRRTCRRIRTLIIAIHHAVTVVIELAARATVRVHRFAGWRAWALVVAVVHTVAIVVALTTRTALRIHLLARWRARAEVVLITDPVIICVRTRRILAALVVVDQAVAVVIDAIGLVCAVRGARMHGRVSVVAVIVVRHILPGAVNIEHFYPAA